MSGSLLAFLPSIFKTVQGVRQARQGRKTLNNLERPDYGIPAGVTEAVHGARLNASDPYMPGENRMLDRVSSSTSNLLKAAKETGNPLSALSGIAASANRANENIGVQSANVNRQDDLRLQQMLMQLGTYQDKEFAYNEFAPYAQKYNEGREMIGAGNTNIHSGLDGLSAIAIQSFGGLQKSTGNNDTVDPNALAELGQKYGVAGGLTDGAMSGMKPGSTPSFASGALGSLGNDNSGPKMSMEQISSILNFIRK